MNGFLVWYKFFLIAGKLCPYIIFIQWKVMAEVANLSGFIQTGSTCFVERRDPNSSNIYKQARQVFHHFSTLFIVKQQCYYLLQQFYRRTLLNLTKGGTQSTISSIYLWKGNFTCLAFCLKILSKTRFNIKETLEKWRWYPNKSLDVIWGGWGFHWKTRRWKDGIKQWT